MSTELLDEGTDHQFKSSEHLDPRDLSFDHEGGPEADKGVAELSVEAARGRVHEVLRDPEAEGAPGSAVDHLLRTEFSDPSLWDADRPSYGYGFYMGLGHPVEWSEVDYSREIITNPEQTWRAGIYGSRVSEGENGDAIVETASLDTLNRIHVRLDGTVLAGENMHIATPVIPPEPEKGNSSWDNNQLWLKMIADGQWPIMAEQLDADGNPTVYSSHDYGDFHAGNMALFPREAQDLISKAARLEYDYRELHHRGAVLRPSGAQEHDNDPFAGGLRGTTTYTDGISKIDDLTDIKDYFSVLDFAMDKKNGSNPAERMAKLARGEVDRDDPTTEDARVCLISMKRELGDLLNYVTLHETGKTTTQEDVDRLFDQVVEGIGRVSTKLSMVLAS